MINIALNTFREIIRNKILYLIILFGFLFIILSIILGTLSIGEDSKIITDFGIAMIEIFGIISVVFIGSQLLFQEIEGKTIYLILSKPIKRYDFILGKFLGFSLIIFIVVILQSILYLGVLFFYNIDITTLILISLFFIYLKLIILISIVLFMSTFVSNILTIVASLLIYIVSHSIVDIITLTIKTKNITLEVLIKSLQIMLPPMESLNTKDFIGSINTFTLNFYIGNIIYAILYIILIMFFTILIFNKKKFER